MNAARFLRQVALMALLAVAVDVFYNVAAGVILGIALIAIFFGG